jgi:nitrilase
VFTPDGELALKHRKLMPTNHERLVWGLGDGTGLTAIDTALGRVGGLICWENLMPLARAALYESGLEIYLAPTADDTDTWLESVRHIARESRAFVLSCCVYQRASSYPDDVPIADGPDLLGRGGSAIVGPDGQYLAGPLWDEEGILYAELDPEMLFRERQRFDAAGHYSRPDVLRLDVRPLP